MKKQAKIGKSINSFEYKFQSKTEAELQNIANENNGFVTEARLAAQRVLENRKN